MEKGIIICVLTLFFSNGFSQHLASKTGGNYGHSIKKEQLNGTVLLCDITPHNPGQWNMKYVSVDIVATCNGKEMTASGNNDLLNIEQKRVLNAADVGTDVVINVNYNYSRVSYYVTVLPEVEAEFPGGNAELTQYLKEAVFNNLPEEMPIQFYLSLIKFTVNEAGVVINVQLSQTSGDQELDRLLLEAINKMPKWIPAQNAKGENVKQEFRLGSGRANNKGC